MMKIWNEYSEDVFSYFEYFNNERSNYNEIMHTMHVYSINSKYIQNIEEKKEFLHRSAEEIGRIYLNNCSNNRKIYLSVVQKIDNPNSQVDKYYKIWKKINKSFDIKDFGLGQEITFEDESDIFYFGVAEVPINNLELALDIVASNPERITIFLSKNIDIENHNSVNDIMQSIVRKGKIDYFKLCISCYMNQGIVIRYGTSFEESEFALIHDPNVYKIREYV
ncbi:hypothetical protein QA584_20200 [Anaerocolumna sp. AGMB13025]|uniref:hypothetical protein n=1 Tax=Anaerocolumna sp. AGMB13025 TaxID=3039116 RepID=UPI00241D82F3|nr:hypothetical protein [Anaerocolumna sp. AGMB13025]WFR55922.1 hypothetical protein QA584_20200 [Anaerocolumna sp. AGMB13025]